MKSYTKLLLILLVLLPLTLLAWGGIRLVEQEQGRVAANITQLLEGQLREVDRSINEQLQTLAVDFQSITSIDHYDPESLRELTRSDPRILQLFVIDPEDLLLFPSPGGSHTEAERDFLIKAAELINDRKLQLSRPNEEGETSEVVFKESKLKANPISQREQPGAWFVWYWGPGMNLIYWQRRPSGHRVGVAVERSRWIADMIAKLPDTPVSLVRAGAAVSRNQIVESGTDVIYKWGTFNPEADTPPTAEIRLATPLNAWQLQSFVPLHLLTANQSGTWNLLTGLCLSGVALIGLAYAIDRQYGREMREAERRVSFVNQVSHELRTPLTNIRMYAELLEQDLGQTEDHEQPQKRLSVILSECQRLSRLISNVLTFARQEKRTLRVCCKRVIPDEIILNVVNSFRPALEQKSIVIELGLDAVDPAWLDPDVLEQILGNLISNVEKYALAGRWIRITSEQTEMTITISVADHGPGIPEQLQPKVFAPYWRASHELSQSAGTGIGLTIVQYLARLHGGDVQLESTSQGSLFQVTLETSTKPGER